jgi:hypothetical protein
MSWFSPLEVKVKDVIWVKLTDWHYLLVSQQIRFLVSMSLWGWVGAAFCFGEAGRTFPCVFHMRNYQAQNGTR